MKNLESNADYTVISHYQCLNNLNLALKYSKSYEKIYYWSSRNKQEVDFVIQHKDKSVTLIEVKSKDRITNRDLAGIQALSEEKVKIRRKIIVCNCGRPTLLEGVEILPIFEFLKDLWKV